ncbi:Aspartate/methionine/tyrosine aminotransferase [Tranquillimonas rosea]|uniref:aspartate transaminase n=1 Tax=Tranquillimonas rosea TaxID=641238 RepID=A0A1H9UD45_9RHOB|nr:pyridoxal phosphate-dependent aminotransferase [Tranquillimonas rosea]SES07269.1 Aspartate/methionine/tyrosine aminotransferase [Tranquillimonas rosea]
MKIAEPLGRLGTESAFEVLARAAALSNEGRDIINLGIGQPDFRTPEHIVEAGVRALRDGHHGYTPANGIPPLREAVAADLERRHGTAVDPGQVIVQPGGKPTMFYAALAFGGPGAEILYPDPGFPIYRSVIEFSGAKAVPVPLTAETGFAFDADTVLSRITPATSLIILNSPANPTGAVTPKEQIDRLVEGLAAHPDVAILSDEIYSRMLYGGQAHASLLSYPEIRHRLILLDGWSKTYAMTGWRLGYAVWPAPLVEPITRLCINDHSCVNAAAQHAGLAALEGPQDAVADMVAEFDRRRRAVVPMLDALPGVTCGDPGGAFYAFADISGTRLTAREAQDLFLEEAGVATIAGTSFGAGGEGYLRVSYAAALDRIEEAMERLATCLKERKT